MVAAALIAACGGGDDDAPPSTTAAPGESAPTSSPGSTTEGDGSAFGAGPADSAAPAGVTGTWEGTYTCSQGETDLRLTLVDVNGGAVDGFFAFAPPRGGGAAGSYRVTGTHSDGTLTLEGLDWVDQPAGFDMVGLQAEVSGDVPDQLKGTVDGAGCESFAVKRASSEPWYAGTWKGGYICAEGRTDATLELTPTGGNEMEAVFDFYAYSGNPDVPSGRYSLTGAWEDNAIHLTAEEWIEQPPGYLMVDISTNPDLAIGPDRIAGSVDDPSCEQFILERAEA
jgi:hypothetical protein